MATPPRNLPSLPSVGSPKRRENDFGDYETYNSMQGRRRIMMEHRVYAERGLGALSIMHTYRGQQEHDELVSGLTSIVYFGACNVFVAIPMAGAGEVGLHAMARVAAERLLTLAPGLASYAAKRQRASGPVTSRLLPFSEAARKLLEDYATGQRIPSSNEEALVAAGLIHSCTVLRDNKEPADLDLVTRAALKVANAAAKQPGFDDMFPLMFRSYEVVHLRAKFIYGWTLFGWASTLITHLLMLNMDGNPPDDKYDTAGLQQAASEGLLTCRPDSPVAHHAMGAACYYGFQDINGAIKWYESSLKISEEDNDEIIGAFSAWLIAALSLTFQGDAIMPKVRRHVAKAKALERLAKEYGMRDWIREQMKSTNSEIARVMAERESMARLAESMSSTDLNTVESAARDARMAPLEPKTTRGKCSACGQVAYVSQLKHCSACKGVPGHPIYCSEGCQKQHWRVHKKDCLSRRKKDQQTP